MKKTLLAALLAAAVLGACGGGDDAPAPPPATSEVPASASQSPAGFIAYLQLLVASMADMLEPVDTSAVVPPADDTGEPTKVD
jgi:ABC-type glycerol-3-phosphate transport system substrate-binding protein